MVVCLRPWEELGTRPADGTTETWNRSRWGMQHGTVWGRDCSTGHILFPVYTSSADLTDVSLVRRGWNDGTRVEGRLGLSERE